MLRPPPVSTTHNRQLNAKQTRLVVSGPLQNRLTVGATAARVTGTKRGETNAECLRRRLRTIRGCRIAEHRLARRGSRGCASLRDRVDRIADTACGGVVGAGGGVTPIHQYLVPPQNRGDAGLHAVSADASRSG